MASESAPRRKLDGETAVVIGGTTGIGRAIALAFADEGADVIATSRSEDAVESVTAELRERGATTTEVACVVRDRASIEHLHTVARESLGSVTILVNSAGSVAQASVTEEPGRVLRRQKRPQRSHTRRRRRFGSGDSRQCGRSWVCQDPTRG